MVHTEKKSHGFLFGVEWNYGATSPALSYREYEKFPPA